MLAPEKLIPHKPPMVLLDSVLDVNESLARCQVTIREDNILYDPEIQGVYAWIAIEVMAQTAAVFAAFQRQQPEAEPQIGFLLSVRNFSCEKPYFALNEVLTIVANSEYIQEDVGVFQGEIFINNKLIACAKLNTFQPPRHQADIYLRGGK